MAGCPLGPCIELGFGSARISTLMGTSVIRPSVPMRAASRRRRSPVVAPPYRASRGGMTRVTAEAGSVNGAPGPSDAGWALIQRPGAEVFDRDLDDIEASYIDA
jgi:hypothetical protein